MTTTTTSDRSDATSDVTHMQHSFADLPDLPIAAEFKRAAHGLPLRDGELLSAASVALAMQGIDAYHHYGYGEHLQIDLSADVLLPREGLVTLAEAAARAFHLYCVVNDTHILLVGPKTAGVGALCLTDYRARLARKAEQRCEHD